MASNPSGQEDHSCKPLPTSPENTIGAQDRQGKPLEEEHSESAISSHAESFPSILSPELRHYSNGNGVHAESSYQPGNKPVSKPLAPTIQAQNSTAAYVSFDPGPQSPRQIRTDLSSPRASMPHSIPSTPRLAGSASVTSDGTLMTPRLL